MLDCFAAAAQDGDRRAVLLESLDAEPVDLSWSRLDRRARETARKLASLGVAHGDRVCLVLPTGEDFLVFFWAILFAGATPAPVYPPAGLRQLATFAGSLGRMVATTTAKAVIVPEPLRDFLQSSGEPTLAATRVLAPEDVALLSGAETDSAAPGSDDLAIIQFSSGSTREPQGICLSHANVLANARAICQRMWLGTDDLVVTWLPLYHDMGLIGAMIAPMLGNIPLVMHSPLDFVRKPSIWLRSMARHRATITVAPQFAYNLCVRKVRAEDLGDADLSSLRMMLNGAEPIRAAGVRAFEERYRSLGLRPNVVTPCYGLGEATLAVSMRHPETGLLEHSVRDDDGRTSDHVSTGPPIDGLAVTILGADDAPVADGEIGEICVAGPSICRGYVDHDKVVSPIDAMGRLHTGDLGFVQGGEVFVTGRKKDLIILGGRNLLPQEIEEEVGRIDGFRAGRVAAFGVRDEAEGTEMLVIVAEGTVGGEDPESRVAKLREQLLTRFGFAPRDVMLIGRGQLPTTTSGKLRRTATRLAYENRSFEDIQFQMRR